jgi:hypothetical protein
MWEDVFSNDWVAASQRFRHLCDKLQDSGINVKSERLLIGKKGPVEEELAIDTCILGDPDCKRLLLSTSGIHGVEGYPGSAIQLHILRDILEEGLPDGIAVLFAHSLNPWGMAWLRRVNENNADLNRNFLPPGEEYSGEPDGYHIVDHLINPTIPPKQREKGFFFKAFRHVLKHGWSKTKQAIAEGQYTRPESMQYGGEELLKGPSLFLEWLTPMLDSAEQVVAIDLHTGLGKFGHDTLLVNQGMKEEKIAGMRTRYGKRVTPLDADKGVAYRTRGDLHQGLMARWPNIDWTCITQEFGTYKPFKVLNSLRKENSWTHHGDVEEMHTHWSRLDLLKAFNPKDDDWRGMLLTRGRILFEQATEELREGAE